MRAGGRIGACALAGLLAVSGPLFAQDTGTTAPVPGTVVLVVDLDRMYADSDFGRMVEAEYETAGRALQAENEAIAAELTAEERSLAERREGMDAEDFQAEAEAFDTRVGTIRADQDRKERELQQIRIRGRERFLQAAQPILRQIMAAENASLIVSSNNVVMSVPGVNITEAAISIMNESLAEGSPNE